MSRTQHTLERRGNRRTRPRAKLTKGKGVMLYNASTMDYCQPEEHRDGSWALWLHDYNGYQKERKRRRNRRQAKRYGRRWLRRSLARELEGRC